MCTVPLALSWLDSHQYLALWLEGIALLAIFIWDRSDASQQHKQTLAQMEIMRNQAEAIINSERAWVVAELIPICINARGFWLRPSGDGWAALNEDEIVNGVYLSHKLKLTNMGRTPAHVLRYHIEYSREIEVTASGLRMVDDDVKHPELDFDRLLSGNDSIEVKDVDVHQYIKDSIKAIGDSDATGVLSGWVEYQHVFSETDVVRVPFAYLYDPSTTRLARIPMPKTPTGNRE
jgi:hypothetical protein